MPNFAYPTDYIFTFSAHLFIILLNNSNIEFYVSCFYSFIIISSLVLEEGRGMAKIGVVLVFVLSLVLVLSIHSVLADDDVNHVQSAIDNVNEAVTTVHEAATTVHEAATNTANSVNTAVDKAKETTSSWFQWFRDILE